MAQLEFRTFELTDEQQTYMDGIRWLLADEPRRTGRSTLLALATLEKAIDNDGVWIRVLDHATNMCHSPFDVIDKIHILFKDLKYAEDYTFCVRHCGGYIKVECN